MTSLGRRAVSFLGWTQESSAEIEVPRVTSLRLETARQRCLEDGLLFAIEPPDLGPTSVVVAQSPPTGALVPEYTTVWVRVAVKRPRWHPRPWRWWLGKVLGS